MKGEGKKEKDGKGWMEVNGIEGERVGRERKVNGRDDNRMKS